ncbi:MULTISPECIES: ABC transporter ATP-binding protein [Inquilinus]|uniref:NitT/TauT family transport system ATP-binding protein n=1 Tax=Inquilinus ginsengisoli TaxID=363840 RepID=A0ABU1JG54_9PROT|nr:ABC transporter ATP-binding protein [Inquilinus ginsengisoli]MDR6287531.1 NitT/TauT family transport system ATP-binding protein [Inquilinus ginsengisoli]
MASPALAPVSDATTADTPALTLDGVSLAYVADGRRVTAVEGVTLDIRRGERLVLLGPSGCGKSSLLRSIGGFLPPSAGRVLLDGRPVSRPGPDRMMVLQDFDQLLPWQTVRRNLISALAWARGTRRAEAEAVADDMLRRVGLARVADQYPHTLSGGMKQRAAIARALVLRPAVLLMDEPFAALDAMTRRRMQEELLALCEETGVTTVFVTHAIDEAIVIGSRIVVMTAHPGRVRAVIDLPCGRGPDRGDPAFAALEARIGGLIADQIGDPGTEATHGRPEAEATDGRPAAEATDG